MKKIFTPLLITVFAFAVYSQQSFVPNPVKIDRGIINGNYPLHKFSGLPNRNHVHYGSRNASASVMLDYAGVDAWYAAYLGTNVYYMNSLAINKNYPNSANLTHRWAIALFDTLLYLDANQTPAFLPRASTALTLDSFDIYCVHQNTTGNFDTISIYIFDRDSMRSTGSGATQNLAGNHLWDTTIITNTTLPLNVLNGGTPTWTLMTFFPHLSFAQGKTFGYRVDFAGDTANKFNLVASFRDDCADACLANTSAANGPLGLPSALYYINATTGGTNLSGVNSLAFNCGPPCEDWYAQNWWIYPYVTADTSGCNLSISTTVTNATCDTCHDGSATAHVTNGSSPITYTWNSSPLQTTQTATGLSPGNYTICMVDANNCTLCTTVFVDSSRCTGLSISTQVTNATCSSCADGSAQAIVTGGIPFYSYTWYTTPVQTTATAVGLPQGTYLVCVSDLSGCMVCDTVTVSIGNCSAHFNLYPDTIPHNYYAVNMASGNGPLTYLWSWGDGTTDTGPFPSHTYASAGLYTICLVITDSAGCTNTHCNNFYLLRTTNTMIHVNVVPALSTGISESAISNPQFAISPNPATNTVTISIDESMIGSTATLTDITGRKLTAVKLTTVNGQLTTENFGNGIYFVTVANGTQSATRKLVVSK